jgi:hypothetical protein
MLDLYDEFKALIAKLAEQEIAYALCGGLAMAVHGLPRATVDIDLLILAESLGPVTALAREQGYTLEAEPMKLVGGAIEIHRLSKLDPDSGDVLTLDLLLVTPALRDVWESRLEVEWEQGKLQVVSRKGLIALKSLRRSGQDLDDIQRLQEDDDES